MPRKTLISALILVLVVGGLAWLNRIDVMLALLKYRSHTEKTVADNREIIWQAGPEQATIPIAERPPNIILIVADDLGINDVSTFGGGVAGGRVKTPNIDQLAAQGAVFNQAYAGNATCAPSRAMIMTGRYPTRTGFEFTPTPSGMRPMVNMIAGSIDNGLPPGGFNDEVNTAAYEDQGLPGSEITVAEMLKDNGYYTAHIGKWHLGWDWALKNPDTVSGDGWNLYSLGLLADVSS